MGRAIRFDELPNWVFEIEETSMGTYVVRGFWSDVLRIERQGHDVDALLGRCRSEAELGSGRGEATGSSPDPQ